MNSITSLFATQKRVFGSRETQHIANLCKKASLLVLILLQKTFKLIESKAFGLWVSNRNHDLFWRRMFIDFFGHGCSFDILFETINGFMYKPRILFFWPGLIEFFRNFSWFHDSFSNKSWNQGCFMKSKNKIIWKYLSIPKRF